MNKPIIILASKSIGRRQLLEKLGVPFRIQPMDIAEEKILHTNPVKILQMRAKAKAHKISQLLKSNKQESFLVITADSEAVLGNKTFGKSQTKDDAKKILNELMGKTHTFVTTSVILFVENGEVKRQWENVSKSLVTLRKLSLNELEDYVTRYDFSRFAGAYTLNETPWDLVTKIDGSYTNVIGLPFEVILPILREFNLLS